MRLLKIYIEFFLYKKGNRLFIKEKIKLFVKSVNMSIVKFVLYILIMQDIRVMNKKTLSIFFSSQFIVNK